MTIGRLISMLEQFPTTASVRYDFAYLLPTSIASWRGDYSEAALGWRDPDAYRPEHAADLPNEVTVGQLLDELRTSVGKTYTGWKGGDYLFASDTALWIDNPGDCSHTIIVAADAVFDSLVVLRTDQIR